MDDATSLSIGELANATGVSISAIRYYEQRTLVTPSGRVGGKRRFGAEALDRLNFVTRAKQAGFDLDQVGVLLDDTTGESRDLLAERLEALKQTRAELDRTIGFVERAASCGCSNLAQCKRQLEF